MKNTAISILLLVTFGINALSQDVVKSKKAYFKLPAKEEPTKPADKLPPKLVIFSPGLKTGESFVSSEDEVELIGKLTDESGIASLIINSKMVEVSPSGMFTTKLLLYEGSNEISVVALDKKDNLLKEKYSVDYVPPVVTFADKVNSQSNYYGLIIGIDNYTDPQITSLDNPVRDATKIYDVLTINYNFEKENVKFLRNADRADIIEALDFLARKVTPNDNLLIFYAGHGWWDENANNGYWLPSNAKRSSKAAWFRNSTLVDYLKEVNTKHTLLIADACFGGAIFKTRDAFPDVSKAVEILYQRPSRKAMTSGTLTEVPDRSAFTRFLVDRLESNEEQYLSSEQLFSSFRIAVINNSDVIPQFGEIKNVGDQGGDFIFIRRTEK